MRQLTQYQKAKARLKRQHETYLDQAKKENARLDLLEGVEIPKSVNISSDAWGCTQLTVQGFQDLNIARRILKDVFGHWEDTVSSIHHFCGEDCYCTYTSRAVKHFQIRVNFQKEATPESFYNDGKCSWEETANSTKYIAWKCNVE